MCFLSLLRMSRFGGESHLLHAAHAHLSDTSETDRSLIHCNRHCSSPGNYYPFQVCFNECIDTIFMIKSQIAP